MSERFLKIIRLDLLNGKANHNQGGAYQKV